MSNITIGRYTTATCAGLDGNDGTERPLSEVWSGWIEGEADDGTSWITFLDGSGRPSLHWPTRGPSGGALGEPIAL